MPSENTKILHFNSYQKSNKTSLIIYADLEALIKKTGGCRNNPEKLPTTKNRYTYPLRVFDVYDMDI